MLDLGISGRKAIVCAASKGLGRACAMALGRAGAELVITARTKETLEQTAAEIRKKRAPRSPRLPATSRPRRAVRRRSLPAPTLTFWSTIAAGRRTAISGNG